MQPHRPVARGADFVAFEVEELVGRHVVGQLVAVAVGKKHGGEYYAVEHDVVLADEIYYARLGVFPPALPRVGQQLLGVGDIAYGGVEPHVEHFSVSPFHGHGYAPVEVAGDGARLQAEVEPRLALAVHIGAPFLVPVENPALKLGLPAVEREIPVECLAQNGDVAGFGAARVYQFGGAERRAAFLALVAIGARSVAHGAFAHHVAVGHEAAGAFVVELHGRFLHESAFVIDVAEKLRRRFGMHVGCGARIYVERYAQACERLLDERMVAVHHILRRDALLAGAYGDGHSVLVAAADEQHFAALQAQIACVDVGRHVHSGQMAYVHRAVGIGESCSDESAFEFIVHEL